MITTSLIREALQEIDDADAKSEILNRLGFDGVDDNFTRLVLTVNDWSMDTAVMVFRNEMLQGESLSDSVNKVGCGQVADCLLVGMLLGYKLAKRNSNGNG